MAQQPDDLAADLRAAAEASLGEHTAAGKLAHTKVLFGYEDEAGGAPEGTRRFWTSLTGDDFFDVLTSDVVHTRELDVTAAPLGGKVVWVRKNAEIVHHQGTTVRADQATFLQGDISGGYMGQATDPAQLAAAAGRGCLAFSMGPANPVASIGCSVLQCTSRFFCVTQNCGGTDFCRI